MTVRYGISGRSGQDGPPTLCWRKIELLCGALAAPEIASLLSAVSCILNAARNIARTKTVWISVIERKNENLYCL